MVIEFFRGAVRFLHKANNEKRQPSWMNGQPLSFEEIAKLSPIDQLRYGVAHEIFKQGLDPVKGEGKRLFQSRWKDVALDWSRIG